MLHNNSFFQRKLRSLSISVPCSNFYPPYPYITFGLYIFFCGFICGFKAHLKSDVLATMLVDQSSVEKSPVEYKCKVQSLVVAVIKAPHEVNRTLTTFDVRKT